MTQRARHVAAAVLWLFVAFFGLAALIARIESDQELLGVLVIDCLVGLALFGYIVLAGDHPGRELRKAWPRLVVAVAAGVFASTVLGCMHICQLELRKRAGERLEQLGPTQENTIPPASP